MQWCTHICEITELPKGRSDNLKWEPAGNMNVPVQKKVTIDIQRGDPDDPTVFGLSNPVCSQWEVVEPQNNWKVVSAGPPNVKEMQRSEFFVNIQHLLLTEYNKTPSIHFVALHWPPPQDGM